MQAILAALALAATPAAGPAADRGVVRSGPPLVHTFAVTNPGPGRAAVGGVSTPCGCLAAAVAKPDLAPGEATAVTLTVNTVAVPPGPHTWRGVVRLVPAGGGPGPPPPPVEVPWALSATVVREVAVTPPAVAVSADAGAAVQVTVTVTDVRSERLRVTAAATTAANLKATVGPAEDLPVGRTVPVTLTVVPAAAGESRETLVIYTDDPACPELRVPVTVTTRDSAAATATPAVARVALSAGQASASTLVQVRSAAGGAIKLEKVESDHPAVKATAAAAGRLATVRVTVTPRPSDGPSGTATVTVTLAAPAGAAVRVPVAWTRPGS